MTVEEKKDFVTIICEDLRDFLLLKVKDMPEDFGKKEITELMKEAVVYMRDRSIDNQR